MGAKEHESVERVWNGIRLLLLLPGWNERFLLLLFEMNLNPTLSIERASLVAQMVKNLLEMQDMQVRSLGWEDPLEKGMTNHSSILSWRIPWTEEPGRLKSTVSQRVGHDWVKHTHKHTSTESGTWGQRKECGYLLIFGQLYLYQEYFWNKDGGLYLIYSDKTIFLK